MFITFYHLFPGNGNTSIIAAYNLFLKCPFGSIHMTLVNFKRFNELERLKL